MIVKNKKNKEGKAPQRFKHALTDYNKFNGFNYINFMVGVERVPWTLNGLSSCLKNSGPHRLPGSIPVMATIPARAPPIVNKINIAT